MGREPDEHAILEGWRRNWLECVAEIADIGLQRRMWLDKTNTNPHWQWVECVCSYDDYARDDYAGPLASDYLSRKEFEAVEALHRMLDAYEPPGGNDYDSEAILADSAWLAVVDEAQAACARLRRLVPVTEQAHLAHGAFLAGGPDAPSTTRATVLLHGVGADAETFRPLMAALAPTGRVLAWNLPGHGGAAPREAYGLAEAAMLLLADLAEAGVETADLVGHSLGGMLALEAYARAPERVGSLAILASTPAFGSKDGAFERAFVAERFAPLDEGRPLADLGPDAVAGMVGEGADEAGVARAVAAFARVPEAAYRASVLAMMGFDRRGLLGSIAVPTLVIGGEADRNAPPRSVARLAEAIPGARLVMLPGAGHLPHLERPGAVAEALREHLAARG